MKRKYLLLLLSLLFAACAADQNESTTQNGDNLTAGDTTDIADSLAWQVVVENPDDYEKPPVDPGESDRKEESVLDNEPCCKSLENIKKCCCDKTIEKYERYLTNEQMDSVNYLIMVDPHYQNCNKQHRYFEPKIEEITDKILGAE